MTTNSGSMTADTAPKSGQRTAPVKKRKSKTKHFWWIAVEDAARELGVFEVPSVCGRAWVNTNHAEPITPEIYPDGSVRVPNQKPQECRVCISMVEAATRRRLQ